jgi:hypothetical protein
MCHSHPWLPVPVAALARATLARLVTGCVATLAFIYVLPSVEAPASINAYRIRIASGCEEAVKSG